MIKSTLKKKLVIAEDDLLLAIVLKKMAVSLGFEILDVPDRGEDAVRSIKENKPDLVFMDILLADETNRIEVMKKVREYSDVPVIYITALSEAKVRSEAGSVGNSFFISKPVIINELKNALKSIQFAA
ncbi:MAG: response regulator [Balneolaceae bacterium]